MDAGLGHALHPGPVDLSVLTLQEHHRSTDIWAGRDFEPLTCRRCDGHFWRLGSLDPRVQQMLLKAGFYGVYKAGRIRLDHALITALVERWRPETHTFHLSVGEATVTLQDIAVLWGLPVDGPPITGVDTNRSMDEWQDICNELLGFRPPPEDFDRGRLKIRCLQERFKILPDNASEETVKYYARAYILQLLGGQLLSDMSNNKVKLMYLPLLRDFEQSGRLSWGSAVLACLYRALCRASKPETSDICGPLVLLQIWAWERLPFVRPGRLSPQPQPQPDFIDDDHPLPAAPWGSRWNVGFKLESVGTHILVLYRDQLDNMKDEQFIWEPYPADVLASLPEYCLSGRRIWQTVSPLICFDVVEFHHPDRAFRQFGQQQTVPSPCDTIPDIHLTDRRGRQNYDWAHHHRQFVDMWEDRYGRVISTPPIEHPMDQNDPYMLWYRRITRSLIGNPAKRPNTGYRGVGGAMEEMAQSLQKIYHRAADAINQGCEVSGQDVLKEIQEICAFSLRAAHEDHRLTLNADMNLPSPSASTLLPPTRAQRGRPGKRGALGGSQASGGRRRGSYVPTLLQTNSLEVSHSPMPSGTPLSIGEMSDTPQTWDSSMSAHDFQDIATSSSMQLDPEATDTKKPILQALGKIQDICSFALRMSNGDQSMPVKQELSPTAPKTKRCKPRRRGGMTAYPVGATSSGPYFQYTSEPSTPTPSASVGPIESHSQLHNVVEHEVEPLVAQMATDSPLTEIENLQSEMIELDTITGSREPSPSYANHPSIIDLPCDPSGHQDTVMLSAEVETNFLIDDNAHMITESEVMAQPVNDEDNPTDAEVLQQTLYSTVAELHVKSPEQEDSDSPIVKCNKASDPRDLLVASNLTAPEHEVSTSHPNPDEVVTELDKPEAEHEVVASDPNSDAVVSEVNEPDSTLEVQSVNSPKQPELQRPENCDSKISSRTQTEHSSPKHNNLNLPSPKQVNTTISESSVHVVSDEASLPEVVEIDTDSVSAGGGKRKGLVLERASSGESTQALVKSEETSDVAKNDQNAVKEDGQRRYYKRQRRSASRNRS